MQKILIGVSILLVVAVGGHFLLEHLDREAYQHSASTRVQAFLDGLSSGGDFEEGFNMWLMGGQSGMGTITQDQYNAYVGEMNAWLDERELGRPVGSYEITGTTLVKGRDGLEPAIVEVEATVDGVPVIFLAVEGEPLTWAD